MNCIRNSSHQPFSSNKVPIQEFVAPRLSYCFVREEKAKRMTPQGWRCCFCCCTLSLTDTISCFWSDLGNPPPSRNIPQLYFGDFEVIAWCTSGSQAQGNNKIDRLRLQSFSAFLLCILSTYYTIPASFVVQHWRNETRRPAIRRIQLLVVAKLHLIHL